MSWPVAGQDACPALADHDGTPCGLLWEHDGEHTRYVPGHYLPAPLLHPLDWLRIMVRARNRVRLCPNGCSPLRRYRNMWGDHISDLSSISYTPPAQTQYLADERQPHIEWQYTVRFEPCGCEYRALTTPGACTSVALVYG